MQAEPSVSSLADKARFASSIARQAGALALERFRTPVTIETKGDASPVTEADRAAESLLREQIARQYPGHGILGEEYGTSGSHDGPLWVVDPIDGTRSFITGWPIWGTLVAYLEGGHPKICVVELPALGEHFVGIAGEGATFHDSRGGQHSCRVRDVTRLDKARFYTTSPRYFDTADRPVIDRLVDSAAVARFGGDCYGYVLLAAGHVDLVVESQLEPYDYMALVPVIEAAGGIVTDWSGAPLTLASDGRVVAAATPELHAEVLALLGG